MRRITSGEFREIVEAPARRFRVKDTFGGAYSQRKGRAWSEGEEHLHGEGAFMRRRLRERRARPPLASATLRPGTPTLPTSSPAFTFTRLPSLWPWGRAEQKSPTRKTSL